MTTPTRDTLLTVSQVAAELVLTDKAVRHLIYSGQLPAYYLAGRRLRIKRRDLDRFLDTELKKA